MRTSHSLDEKVYVSASGTVKNIHTASDEHNGRDAFGRVSELIKTLTNDVGKMVTLQIDLLKTELRDSAKTLARDSALLITGAVLAYVAFCAVTLAVIGFIASVLPIDLLLAVAVSALIVGVVYAIIAGGLAWAGINHLKKRGIAPERSIQEVKRDKEWVKEIK